MRCPTHADWLPSTLAATLAVVYTASYNQIYNPILATHFNVHLRRSDINPSMPESRRTGYLCDMAMTATAAAGAPRTAMSIKYDGLSHCKLALVFAVLMDLLGVVSLLLGVFAPLEIQGRDFGDLLVYSGALFVLMSLGGWVMWYSGNIEGLTSKKELGGPLGGAMERLAYSLSRRIRMPRSHSSPS
ncbi:transmembrane protein 238-like [Lampris incognitus]|uniref:transmembrane protein 238-like n=1 Tax=Lampris incognitus TaxID=2546036 RepID=UPI0024B5DA24|nr:transmembrane protein 238-like [Lampris incognitus]